MPARTPSHPHRADPLTGPIALLDRSSARVAEAPPRRRGRHAAPDPELDPELDAELDALPDPAPAERRSRTVAAPAWPCPSCSARTPMERSTCDGCGLPFLADLRAPAPSVRLPGIGEFTQASKGLRMGLAVAAALAATVLVVGLLSLVGLLF
ncbi:MAG: hypothetical protein M3Z02_10625 [Actinomycetota bacterium]|nr:hypothetical protein [Actinomycetota bacterium]